MSTVVDNRPNTPEDDAAIEAAGRFQKSRRSRTWANDFAMLLEASPRLRRVVRVVCDRYGADEDDIGQIVKIGLVDAIDRRAIPQSRGLFAVAWQIASRACSRENEKRRSTISLDELAEEAGGSGEIADGRSAIDAIQDKLHHDSLVAQIRKYREARMQKQSKESPGSIPIDSLPAPLANITMKPKIRPPRPAAGRGGPKQSVARRTPEQQRLYELWMASGLPQIDYVTKINEMMEGKVPIESGGRRRKFYQLSLDAFKAYIAGRTRTVNEHALSYAEQYGKLREKEVAALNAYMDQCGGLPGMIRDWAQRIGITEDEHIDKGVAEAIDANHTTINRWRRGFQKPSIDDLMASEACIRLAEADHRRKQAKRAPAADAGTVDGR